MNLLNVPIEIWVIFILEFVGTPLLVEITVRSKWWKKKSDYYYSFNKKESERQEK